MRDVVHGLLHAVHDPHVQDEIVVLGEVISVGGGLQFRVSSSEFRVQDRVRRSVGASSTFLSHSFAAICGRNRPATTRSTSNVSIALHTAGRWHFAFRTMLRPSPDRRRDHEHVADALVMLMTGNFAALGQARIRLSPPRGMHKSTYCVRDNSAGWPAGPSWHHLNGVFGKGGNVWRAALTIVSAIN